MTIGMAMVIDDDDFMQEVLSTLLQDMGIPNVICESNAESALSHFRKLEQQPDLLICDLCMPGMDGIEFLRSIAEQGYHGDMILLSGMDAAVLKAAQLLAQSYAVPLLGTLSKPVSVEALRALMERDTQTVTQNQTRKPARQKPTAAELTEAIVNDEISIYFQPKVNLATRKIHAAECLARWMHPERGMIDPGDFITLAEENGLIHSITLTVLRKAARQLSVWRQNGVDIHLSVNVSMEDINQLDIPEIFSGIVNLAGITPADITLEVTESRLAQNFVLSLDVLTRLRIKGFGLSIDDFGTGYSSLESLKQLPFTELKVDQSFVRNAGSDKSTRAILESSLRLGHNFKLNLVAEGVETQAEWDLVAKLGCHEAQGYYISRPLPAADFLAAKSTWEAQHVRSTALDTQIDPHASGKPIVIVADDDPMLHELVRESLANTFQLVHAYDGQACLDALSTIAANVVILDINMPRMDGISACQIIKNTEKLADMPVLFITGLDSIEDRMRCYEAGADDFILKPFKFELLAAKVHRLLALGRDREKLRATAHMATSVAMTAMTSMSEMGILLEGLKKFSQCHTHAQLAEACLDTLRMLELSGTVQLRFDQDALTCSSKGLVSPLDISVIEHMARMDRVVHFKSRMSVTYEHVTLLVSDMPVDDVERSGRLRDHISMLVEAAESHLQGISANLRAIERGEILARTTKQMGEILHTIDISQRNNQAAVKSNAAEIIAAVENALRHASLSRQEEDIVLTAVRASLDKIAHLQGESLEIQNRLSTLIADMRNSVKHTSD